MVKKSGSSYSPEQGDVVWLEFDPPHGTEIKKKRPALTLSPKSYNDTVGLAIFCPITSHKKGYPFEVNVTVKGLTEGVILADQLKNLDWRVRKAQFITSVSNDILEEV